MVVGAPGDQPLERGAGPAARRAGRCATSRPAARRPASAGEAAGPQPVRVHDVGRAAGAGRGRRRGRAAGAAGSPISSGTCAGEAEQLLGRGRAGDPHAASPRATQAAATGRGRAARRRRSTCRAPSSDRQPRRSAASPAPVADAGSTAAVRRAGAERGEPGAQRGAGCSDRGVAGQRHGARPASAAASAAAPATAAVRPVPTQRAGRRAGAARASSTTAATVMPTALPRPSAVAGRRSVPSTSTHVGRRDRQPAGDRRRPRRRARRRGRTAPGPSSASRP